MSATKGAEVPTGLSCTIRSRPPASFLQPTIPYNYDTKTHAIVDLNSPSLSQGLLHPRIIVITLLFLALPSPKSALINRRISREYTTRSNHLVSRHQLHPDDKRLPVASVTDPNRRRISLGRF